MGSRNIRKKETKKPKKNARKTPQVSIIAPQPAIEVIRKGKKRQDREEEAAEED